MHYQQEAIGDWGQMQNTPTTTTTTEELTTADGCTLFLRSWITSSPNILLLLHGLGAHSGWFIDMGNELSARGLTVYAMDHRGFGRSKGLSGHIDNYHTFLSDIGFVLDEIRKRHPDAKLYILGHSMGGIFASHFASAHQDKLAGVLFLNPWVRDGSKVSLGMTLRVLFGGLVKSKHYWTLAGGTEGMTTNPEAARMLDKDTYWRRAETSSFFFQILQMRSAILSKAKRITIPALVLQAEKDKSVIIEASHDLFNALASPVKTWQTYPTYAHDSELEADHSQMDDDIVEWIGKH